MHRKKILVSLILVFLSWEVFNSFSFAQEQKDILTLTTYYPAPYGVYNELSTNSLIVGNINKRKEQLCCSYDKGIALVSEEGNAEGFLTAAVSVKDGKKWGGVLSAGCYYDGNWHGTGSAVALGYQPESLGVLGIIEEGRGYGPLVWKKNAVAINTGQWAAGAGAMFKEGVMIGHGEGTTRSSAFYINADPGQKAAGIGYGTYYTGSGWEGSGPLLGFWQGEGGGIGDALNGNVLVSFAWKSGKVRLGYMPKSCRPWNFLNNLLLDVNSNCSNHYLVVTNTGGVGINTSNPDNNVKLDVNGDVKIRETLYVNDIQGFSADIAERFICEDCQIADVVRIDPKDGKKVIKTSQPYTKVVAGVISETPFIYMGRSQEKTDSHLKPVALVGKVLCKVTTENGPIKIGDILVSSSKPGYAMKANPEKITLPTQIVGIALEELKEKEGKIKILIK
jgi:hypothetical protein